MKNQAVTINIHSPRVNNARVLKAADAVSVQLSNGEYDGTVTLIFSSVSELTGFVNSLAAARLSLVHGDGFAVQKKKGA